MNSQINFTSNPKFVQALSEGYKTDKMTLDEVLLRHYHIKKVLQSILSEDELNLLDRILVEQKVRRELLGEANSEQGVFESLYEKLHGPIWEKYED
ncbi:hypothetical protein JOD02_001843 [Caldicoprobacter guelmensis]|uniref:hypothetical protein n=1 Tax=Caldicoprobacter guelmensis TaxID=1170224 RepID=UPI0019580349|nr:hypothetical protein [Caldicoprobacter guelmensis]MBM7582974.1 hypothetical protein [Caldicoprobacter guelmensis]